MPYVLAVTVGFVLGVLIAGNLIEAQEVKVVTDEPVTCVVELYTDIKKQRVIHYEGKVK